MQKVVRQYFERNTHCVSIHNMSKIIKKPHLKKQQGWWWKNRNILQVAYRSIIIDAKNDPMFKKVRLKKEIDLHKYTERGKGIIKAARLIY